MNRSQCRGTSLRGFCPGDASIQCCVTRPTRPSGPTRPTTPTNSGGSTSGSCNTVQACARILLSSPNVSYWTGLSTGSDRSNMQRLANGQTSYVPTKRTYVMPKLRMMQALVAMSRRGRIMINALTGGKHSTNSNHYRGTAVDLDLNTGTTSMIVQVGAQFGCRRNSETSHIHLDC